MIIDCHTHTGVKLGFNMSEEKLLEAMEKYNIDFCIFSDCESAECDHNRRLLPKNLQQSQEEVYRQALRFARKHKGRLAVMPWVKPQTQGVTEELEQLIAENLDITAGIKVHPYHSNMPFDGKEVESYIKLAEKYDLPVLTHTGNSDVDDCTRVFNMAEKYPKVKFIMGHMGLGTDNSKAIELMKRQPNLYGDTAWVPIESTIKAMAECGSDRMVFGSDATIDGVDTYNCNPKGEPSMYRQYFGKLKELLPKENYDKLMYKNAMDVFNLNKFL